MRASRGFTMVELIMVILVLGVLASVALPRLTDRTSLQERGFRDALHSMLRDARRVAVMQQRDVCVLRQAGPPQVAAMVYAPGAACNGAAVSEPGNTLPYLIEVPAGVAWGGAAQVRFNAAGQPVPNASQVLNIGGGTVTVARETGFASVP